MSWIDWLVLIGTLLFIVLYGVWKTRGTKSVKSYLKGDDNMKWWTIGLSIMATQASAITFLSAPGQAYGEGLGFIQFYFGVPIAMVIVSAVFVPLYFRLKVYTAYEFLENRFDVKTRQLTAILFMLNRGLAAAITIYAPAIILSAILGVDMRILCLLIGILVIVYTVSGGTKAVSQTHKLQLAVMMGGMIVAFIMLLLGLPEGVGFGDAMDVAGSMGKMDIINTEFNPAKKYTIWSGIIAGTFLSLSYFGTDQSQVQRYLGGKSVKEIRTGLMFNGLLKIPMQFFILLVGVMVFVFFQFHKSPIYFNEQSYETVQTIEPQKLNELESAWSENFEQKQVEMTNLFEAKEGKDPRAYETAAGKLKELGESDAAIRQRAGALVKETVVGDQGEDLDYVFISYITKYLPVGLIGLLFAVMFSAAMSSTAAELNALGSTGLIDFYKRSFKKEASDKHYLNASRLITLGFGVVAILFALSASLFDNLIEWVNKIGSLFYGAILGVFLVGFFIKYIKGRAVFIGAIMAELLVLGMFILTQEPIMGDKAISIGFMWYNLIGPFAVLVFSLVLQLILGNKGIDSGDTAPVLSE